MNRFRLSPEAVRDIEEILAYIARDSARPPAACATLCLPRVGALQSILA